MIIWPYDLAAPTHRIPLESFSPWRHVTVMVIPLPQASPGAIHFSGIYALETGAVQSC